MSMSSETSSSADRARVLLVGLGPTSQTALDGLVEHFEVVAVVRPGDDETTRHAAELGVPVIPDATVAGVTAAVHEHEPDAVVVSSFDRILGASILSRCPFVNVHYAPLPRGRGRATVNWAILNGDESAAISIHHLTPGLDSGGILYQATVPIGERETVADLYERLNGLQRDHIAAATAAAIAGEPGEPQDETAASWYCTRVPDDGELDWSSSSATVDRMVRALKPPFPPAFTWLGLERVSIESGHPIEDPPRYEGRIPGRVVSVDRSSGHVDVLTGDGVFRLERVRLDNEEATAASDVIRSVKSTLGLRTADLVEALRQARAR